MVSLTDENRILVKYGLGVLQHSQRMGLQELLRSQGIVRRMSMKKRLFSVVPRLNALGHLGRPLIQLSNY